MYEFNTIRNDYYQMNNTFGSMNEKQYRVQISQLQTELIIENFNYKNSEVPKNSEKVPKYWEIVPKNSEKVPRNSGKMSDLFHNSECSECKFSIISPDYWTPSPVSIRTISSEKVSAKKCARFKCNVKCNKRMMLSIYASYALFP